MESITCFRGEYYFLSNMYPCSVWFEGMLYPCVESAFQAAKCWKREDREPFTHLNGYNAKKLGRRVHLRGDWENRKLEIMYRCVKSKFFNNPELKERLLATENRPLVEENSWNDKFWGVSHGIGANHLGKILMQVRRELL